ncbi:hypothetical protein DL98DRAFT_576771 [Cadophora sp. DSE1049]|nr:hypothetical protein DL98DRAFT_576771 [Cadophora sp. DSE1049]
MARQCQAYRYTIMLLNILFMVFPVLVCGQAQLFFSELPTCSVPCAANETERLQCHHLDSTCVCQKVVGATLYDCFAKECLVTAMQDSIASVQKACANCTAESCLNPDTYRDAARTLSPGAIAGIVVGVTVAVFGLCAASFLLGTRQARKQVKSREGDATHVKSSEGDATYVKSSEGGATHVQEMHGQGVQELN